MHGENLKNSLHLDSTSLKARNNIYPTTLAALRLLYYFRNVEIFKQQNFVKETYGILKNY
jgi:hypothetical protein